MINGHPAGEFIVVRPHFNSSYLTQIEMESMVDTLREKNGYLLTIEEDAYVEPSTYEIIVGNTNRDGVKTITDYDAYDITISGTKVYLNGGSPYATAMAVSEFAKMLFTGSVTDANSTTGSYKAAVVNYDKATRFAPTWVENFDEATVNENNWNILSGLAMNGNGVDGKISIRSADPDVVYVKDGKLYLAGKYDEKYYYGAMLKTDKDHMVFKFGYLEESAVIPSGEGFWSAFWTQSDDNPGTMLMMPEIDMHECFGNGHYFQANYHAWPFGAGEAMGYTHTSLDGGKYANDKRYSHPDGGLFSDTFHTVGFLWTDTYMASTCDGEIFFKYEYELETDLEAFTKHKMNIILSLAPGDDRIATTVTKDQDVWQNTNKLIEDYIHLYQLDDGKCELVCKDNGLS